MCLALGGDLAEVFRAALGGLLPALRAQDGGGGFFQQIVGEMERGGQQLVSAFRSAFGKCGRAEDVVCSGNRIAERV